MAIAHGARFRHRRLAWRSLRSRLASRQRRSSPIRSIRQPTRSVKEQLLQQFKTIQGRGTIPDTKSYTLEQPAGRDWRHFHEVTLRWIGGIAILGMLALLVVFYLSRGMVRIESGRSGRARWCASTPSSVSCMDDGDLLRHARRSPGSTSRSASRCCCR